MTIKDYGVRSMISIPGSLSFAKLVMMSSGPANLRGMPDTRPKIHSFLDCPIQSRFQSVLGVRSFYVERNKFVYKNFEVFWIGMSPSPARKQRLSTLLRNKNEEKQSFSTLGPGVNRICCKALSGFSQATGWIITLMTHETKRTKFFQTSLNKPHVET